MGDSDDSNYCRPFLKWVGGKRQLLPEITKYLPPINTIKSYYEPFVGGGAVFFALQPGAAVISDINAELINAYQVVATQVEELIDQLKAHRYSKDYFYKQRELDRAQQFETLSKVERASRLIYLNKTCYNGLYRVNAKGQFNTPFGRYDNPTILDAANLRACSLVLQRARILHGSFIEAVKSATKQDFVYFDPPYTPISKTASFTAYTNDGFDFAMQQKLQELCCELDQKGVRFMLSNADTEAVHELYHNFNVISITANRSINSKGSLRRGAKEVLIKNYT